MFCNRRSRGKNHILLLQDCCSKADLNLKYVRVDLLHHSLLHILIMLSEKGRKFELSFSKMYIIINLVSNLEIES